MSSQETKGVWKGRSGPPRWTKEHQNRRRSIQYITKCTSSVTVCGLGWARIYWHIDAAVLEDIVAL